MTIQRRRHWHLRASFTISFSARYLAITPDHHQSSRSKSLRICGEATPASALSQILRLERVEVPGGAELITVHAKLAGLESTENDKWVPLVSILRDTLGDNDSREQSAALRLAVDLHAPDDEATLGGSDSVLLHARRQ